MLNIELIQKWTAQPRNLVKWVETRFERIDNYPHDHDTAWMVEREQEDLLAAHRAEAYKLVDRLTR